MDINNVNNNNNHHHVPLSKNMQIHPMSYISICMRTTANTHLNTKSPLTLVSRARALSLLLIHNSNSTHNINIVVAVVSCHCHNYFFESLSLLYSVSFCMARRFLCGRLFLSSYQFFSFSFCIFSVFGEIRLNLSLVLLPHIIINSQNGNPYKFA